jgi:hypothetical protein
LYAANSFKARMKNTVEEALGAHQRQKLAAEEFFNIFHFTVRSLAFCVASSAGRQQMLKR